MKTELKHTLDAMLLQKLDELSEDHDALFTVIPDVIQLIKGFVDDHNFHCYDFEKTLCQILEYLCENRSRGGLYYEWEADLYEFLHEEQKVIFTDDRDKFYWDLFKTYIAFDQARTAIKQRCDGEVCKELHEIINSLQFKILDI